MDEKKFLPRTLALLRQRAQQLIAASRRQFACFYAYLMRQAPLRRGVLVLGLAAAALGGLLFLYVLVLIPTTPSIKDLQQARIAKASTILSADGQELANFSPRQQERIKLSQVSPYVIQALVATEDHRFYQHHGVDFRRTAGAILYTMGGDAQGGSTITQQLARNLFPEEIGRSRSISRKLKEIVTAFKIERAYSKEQILETYLNTMPFLYNAFGIEMAARTYFDKSAAKLNVLESATLVGMLKGTHYYNPVLNPERALERRNVVLGQMHKHGHLRDAQYKSLLKKPLRVRFHRQYEPSDTAETHFTAYVRKWLIEWADQNDYDLQLDGLIIHTTLDAGLQKAALRAVERQAGALQNIADVEWAHSEGGVMSTSTDVYASVRRQVAPFRYFWDSHRDLQDGFTRESDAYKQLLEGGASAADALKKLQADSKFIAQLRSTKTRLETGFVAIDPNSGEVRAWVGSRDFQHDQFDHVAQAERQPGSTFKPIVYGAALEKGLRPDRPYRDSVIDIRAGDGTIWRPTDMSASSGKTMTLRQGLIYSKNTITAQVGQDVGLPDIVKLARAVGINQSKLAQVPSLVLGTSPVTLLEMVSAYSTIAAQGEYRKPAFIKSISDRSGKVLATFEPESRRAMSAESAVELIDMMRGVVNQGTGQAVKSRFGISADIAGKTGTTQNNTDGWFILMHPDLVAGAWVGFNDARVTMRSNYWGQGGHNAVLVVGDFFRSALSARLIDARATFPGGKLQPVQSAPVIEEQTEQQTEEQTPEDWMDQMRRLPQQQQETRDFAPNPYPDDGGSADQPYDQPYVEPYIEVPARGRIIDPYRTAEPPQEYPLPGRP
ncbi:MAG: transglycosylase domain-containing protein [Burkholderiaceae bacterium]